MKSWKTTLAGIAAILTAVAAVLNGIAGDALATIDWPATIAAFVAGIGLISARDNNKRSKDVGAGEDVDE